MATGKLWQHGVTDKVEDTWLRSHKGLVGFQKDTSGTQRTALTVDVKQPNGGCLEPRACQQLGEEGIASRCGGEPGAWRNSHAHIYRHAQQHREGEKTPNKIEHNIN